MARSPQATPNGFPPGWKRVRHLGQGRLRTPSRTGGVFVFQTVNCYLIDNNGFILVSEDYAQVSDKCLPTQSEAHTGRVGRGKQILALNLGDDHLY